MKALADQRTKNMKAIQEKMKLSNKEMARFNPVRTWPAFFLFNPSKKITV